jgi:hypothetical protein
LGVTLGAAWLVFRSIDWTVLARLLAGADLMRLVLAAVVLALQFALLIWRWRIIRRDTGR